VSLVGAVAGCAALGDTVVVVNRQARIGRTVAAS